MQEGVGRLRSGAGGEREEMGGREVGCENAACRASQGAAVGAAWLEGWGDGDGDEVGG